MGVGVLASCVLGPEVCIPLGSGETAGAVGVDILAEDGVATAVDAAADAGITEGVAQTFKDGIYSTTTLQEDLVLTRYSGGRSQPIGQFWTRTTYSSPGRAQQYLALPPENTAVNTTTIRVPAGTTVYEGKAAAQEAWGENGGGNQVFIPYVDPAWIVP
jgi:hypothetical protein